MHRTRLAASFCALMIFILVGCGGGGSGGSISSAANPVISITGATNSALAFGSVGVGSSSSQTLTVGDATTSPLTISSISVSDTADYTVTNSCPGTLTFPQTCTVAVAFSPKSAASLPATLTFADNSGGSSTTQTIALTGTGVTGAAMATLSGTISFSGIAVGAQSTQSATLSNPGAAALAISSIAFGGANASAFSETNTCGTSLAAGASCSIAVTFAPTTAGTSYSASLVATDNSGGATGSSQSLTVSGTSSAAPGATLSNTSLSFNPQTIATTSAAQTVTLTDSGTAALNVGNIVLTGANASSFAVSGTCANATLAVGGSCTISVTFSPAAAQTYTAAITIMSNAAASPQTIALSGSGTTTVNLTTHTLYTFPEADGSVTPLYNFVLSAKKTVDMTMYELQDTTFVSDLEQLCAAGVTVRVILSSSEKSNNQPSYTSLNTGSKSCTAVFSNTAFTNTHQKTITIDQSQTAILSLNLQTQYYSTTRDYALITNDANDISAIEATFTQDYTAGTPYNGTQGASDFAYTPATGDDLIWSPTTAQAAMLALINNAQKTLYIENEELSAANIVSAMVAACQRGVTLDLTMTYSSSYTSNWTLLKNAGCSVHTYVDNSTTLYIHGKTVVADYGLATQAVYMGSINYSTASMNNNRELGLYLSDTASVSSLYTTLMSDYAGGTPY
jgi:cardiolipin synthase